MSKDDANRSSTVPLKSCPFCGGDALTLHVTEAPDQTAYVACQGCAAHGPAAFRLYSKPSVAEIEADALVGWNERCPPGFRR